MKKFLLKNIVEISMILSILLFLPLFVSIIKPETSTFFLILILLPVAIFSPIIAFLIRGFLVPLGTGTSEIDILRQERVEITNKIEANKDSDIFNTIQLSLNRLDEYYTINLNQARRSFWFSISAIVLGLAVIVSGILLNYAGRTTIQLTFLSGISGILLEFIGGAYFFMYKKSLEQVNLFYTQLIKVQDTMLAINLARNIKDDTKKMDMEEKIISSLLERSLK